MTSTDACVEALLSEIRKRSSGEPGASIKAITDTLAQKYPGSAFVFYGSGNSVSADEAATDIVFDFYVIGRSYKDLYDHALLRIANRVIPPNVFYLEVQTDQGTVRAKYAVLSIDHFERLNSPKTFHSYFWARFAQPCRILSDDTLLTRRIEYALVNAISTFLGRSAGLIDNEPFAPELLWQRGLGVSYKAELRAEDPSRAKKLIASYGDWAANVTAPALMAAEIPTKTFADKTIGIIQSPSQRRTRLAWKLRSLFGGFLSVIRLLKGTQTFDGGIEYIAWKIERHTGVHIPLSDWERAHPFLATPQVVWRYRNLRKTASSKAP